MMMIMVVMTNAKRRVSSLVVFSGLALQVLRVLMLIVKMRMEEIWKSLSFTPRIKIRKGSFAFMQLKYFANLECKRESGKRILQEYIFANFIFPTIGDEIFTHFSVPFRNVE